MKISYLQDVPDYIFYIDCKVKSYYSILIDITVKSLKFLLLFHRGI